MPGTDVLAACKMRAGGQSKTELLTAGDGIINRKSVWVQSNTSSLCMCVRERGGGGDKFPNLNAKGSSFCQAYTAHISIVCVCCWLWYDASLAIDI